MSYTTVFSLEQIILQLQTQWGDDDEGSTRHWHDASITYSMPDLPPLAEMLGYQPMTPGQEAFAREAFELWDDLIAISLNESSSPFAQITMVYASPTKRSYTDMYHDDGVMESASIVLSTTRAILQEGTLDYGRGFRTYVHEIGHSLGLSHPGTYDSGDDDPDRYIDDAEYSQDTEQFTLMSYFDAGSESNTPMHQGFTASTPLLHDIAAIQAIYGADMTTRTGDTVYGFNSNAGRGAFDFTQNTRPVVAIWDAGGNDTLDTSGFTDDQFIDLHAGSFSNVGRLINNLAIAYNVVIENAIGGSAIDIMHGNHVANRLEGRAGNDALDGHEGADTMIGGPGDDGYVVDTADSWTTGEVVVYTFGDQVIEAANEGRDSVASYISYALPANVEELRLVGDVALNGSGNELDNFLWGNDRANHLDGRAGSDVIDGRAGADVMAGGAGDDVYYVDTDGSWIEIEGRDGSSWSFYIQGDRVIEHAGEGTDLVHATFDYTLPDNVEDLVLDGFSGLDGFGNGLDNHLVGNFAGNGLEGRAGNDRMDGGGGADTMTGGAGNDTYWVDHAGDQVIEASGEGTDLVNSAVSFTLGANVENLILTGAAVNGTGNGLANVIGGNDAANVLDGAGGADWLVGDGGNDTYQVDNVGDQVFEASGAGTDLVYSSVSFTLGENVERLTLTGATNLNGTGNGLGNTITGNAGANVLDGGAGGDLMTGGAGNDTYIVDAISAVPFFSDQVVEASGQGTDLVRSSVSFALGAHVENLILTGSAAITGTGNALANSITGNNGANLLDGSDGSDTLSAGAGNDTLDGGNGIDTLTGGAGHDNFRFATPVSPAGKLGSANADRIIDFSVADDTIQLSHTIFTALATFGALAAEAFHMGAAAHDADDRIVYDSSTGYLMYDADGIGAGLAATFALLTTGLALTHQDFLVV
jgi:Ca2+-binding RTX toxin-like protein